MEDVRDESEHLVGELAVVVDEVGVEGAQVVELLERTVVGGQLLVHGLFVHDEAGLLFEELLVADAAGRLRRLHHLGAAALHLLQLLLQLAHLLLALLQFGLRFLRRPSNRTASAPHSTEVQARAASPWGPFPVSRSSGRVELKKQIEILETCL